MAPSAEVTKKPADTFDIRLDYLVDDTGKLTDIKDKAFLSGYFRLKSLIRKTGKQLCMQLTAC
jgi:hypothetical protein